MNELWLDGKLFSEHCKAKLSSVFGRQREHALLWQKNVEEWGRGQQVFLFISAHSPIFNTWIIDLPMLAVRKNMQCFYLQTNISMVKEKLSHTSDLSPMWVCVSYLCRCWICWTQKNVHLVKILPDQTKWDLPVWLFLWHCEFGP